MNINLHLDGELAAYIESLIKRGFAASKTEAARMMLVQQYRLQSEEMAPFEQMVDERSQRAGANIQKAYASGKLKSMSEAEFRKKYSHLLK
ncbi:MAG: hypothetical protein V1728_01825 [Candidatus Micrarchaeota archaeon]